MHLGKVFFYSFLVLSSASNFFCIAKAETRKASSIWDQNLAKNRLLPFFQHAAMEYPPQRLALLVFKKNHRLELWAKDKSHSHWIEITAFPILAASGNLGPKLRQGDYQVPEGIYQINRLNPNSHFHLSMGLNYPNQFDRQVAKYDGRQQLGGDIFIHGGKSSAGCIAIGDEAIEQLFPLVSLVGLHRVKVIIAPNDDRSHKSALLAAHPQPQWISALYEQIDQELNEFV